MICLTLKLRFESLRSICYVLDVTTDGYDCRCESGFEKKRDPATGKVKCVDVDECKNPLACDSNAECTNTEGTYTCTCNTGYFGNGLLCEPLCGPLTCGPYKTCEISADNKPECKCRVPSNLQKGNKGVTLMCGTDGKEYTSATQMISANCPLDIKVEVDYVGPCKEDCESIECLGGSKCIEDPVHGRPTCKCDKKCNETIYEPGQFKTSTISESGFFELWSPPTFWRRDRCELQYWYMLNRCVTWS